MLEKAYPKILGGRCPACKNSALDTIETITINEIDTDRCIACGWIEIDFSQVYKACKDRAKQFSVKDNPNVACFNKDNNCPFCEEKYCPLLKITE